VANNLFKRYEVDPAKEKSGVEVDIEGNIFICRRAGGGNRAYRTAVAKHSMDPKYRAMLRSDDPEQQMEAEDEISLNAVADAVVVGWRDVVGRDDQPLPFSHGNFLDLMRSCPDVWMQLRVEVRNIDLFRLEEVKTLGDELGNSSAGNDDTE